MSNEQLAQIGYRAHLFVHQGDTVALRPADVERMWDEITECRVIISHLIASTRARHTGHALPGQPVRGL